MFDDDSSITTADLVELKQHCLFLHHLDIDELILCAYMDNLPLCGYLKSVIENDYDLNGEENEQHS